ncbi:hypothetical protein SNOG_06477 [Parastagonospora nodorum SN15]|uniref:Uncharacterized protein n=1 Tax=Phaeosphaeria nodorum (strain SN15 / ATCC MYA-4574 / FGSC 10173) TaxID=321614 RepID=Q0UP37_PHANO|nr:hypothetical protein SNOG_06477 [Parastagonospora nodorum SN15]EAT86308.1 hypothetical protein SNOG_06477 [Parastagonospora nodorum SN15]
MRMLCDHWKEWTKRMTAEEQIRQGETFEWSQVEHKAFRAGLMEARNHIAMDGKSAAMFITQTITIASALGAFNKAFSKQAILLSGAEEGLGGSGPSPGAEAIGSTCKA